jgi:Zn-dependent peptidase ImmA (M78 family)
MFNRDVINNVADLVRSSLKLSLPYDPEIAVKELGGRIIQDVDDMAVDAYIKKEGEDSFVINLNGKKPFLRERFTIAHELGHLFLHMGFLIDKELWKSQDEEFQDSAYYRYRMSGKYSQEESEANEFAAAFLMPRDAFRKQIYENLSNNNRIDIHAIAEYFKVSPSAVLTRAKWLGYVEW